MKTDVRLTQPGWRSSPDGLLHFWSPFPSESLPSSIGDYGLTEEVARGLTGHWAAISLKGTHPVLAEDAVRSRPLFYAQVDGEWVVTDDIDSMRGTAPWKLDQDQAELFPRFGYSLGEATLISGVSAVPAGSVVELGEGASVRTFIRYRFAVERVDDPSAFSELFTEALDASFGRLLSKTAGAQLAVPLSGGLDSRLLLAWLKRCGAENVMAFSYGSKGSEVAEAQAVAEQLEVPFYFVGVDAEGMREAWQGILGADFRAHTWRGTSLPHVQDWYAISQLKSQGLLDEDAVFLPGHTIVGNMHDEWLLSGHCDAEKVVRALAHHHGGLLGDPKVALASTSFIKAAARCLADAHFDGSASTTQAAIEWFNLRERQAKYINNSMAGYEYFGYRWALPMLDAQMWDAWLRGSESLTSTRRWYADFVNEVYQHEGGRKTELYDPRMSVTKKLVKSGVAQMVARSSIGPVLDNLRIAAIDRPPHPLGLDAFDPPRSRASRAVARARGISRVGEWARAFIANRWGGSGPLPE